MKAKMKIAAKAARIGKGAYSYLKDDVLGHYALLSPACVALRGAGIGVGCAKAGPLEIASERGGDSVVLWSEPFGAETANWNGPNAIPDCGADGSMEASLWHDLIWRHSAELCRQLGMGERELHEWSNGILAAAWLGYGEKFHGKSRASWRQRAKARIAYNACAFGSWIKRHFFAIALAGLCSAACAGCGGCQCPPDWEMEDATVLEYDPAPVTLDFPALKAPEARPEPAKEEGE